MLKVRLKMSAFDGILTANSTNLTAFDDIFSFKFFQQMPILMDFAQKFVVILTYLYIHERKYK